MKKILILLSITGLMCLPYACGDREEMLPIVTEEWQAETAQTTVPVINADAAFFGPEEFSRIKGAPNVYTRNLEREDFECFLAPFMLKVINGDAGGDLKTRVSAAVIRVDGAVILDTTDFNKNVAGIELEVEVLSGSVLTVELMGQPGSYITLDIEAGYDPFCGDSGTFTDERDGEEYDWVRIGGQIWMAENLRATEYLNGDIIPNLPDGWQWLGTAYGVGACCYYDNNPAYVPTYGVLYNWFTTVDPRELCPDGWHVPTTGEWSVLENHLGGPAIAGGKMKTIGVIENGTGLWLAPNTAASNISGFNGIPGGHRTAHVSSYGPAIYGAMDRIGYWWSSTISTDEYNRAWSRNLLHDQAYCRLGHDAWRAGFSVRCVKD
jgi:uncharacterized protein (TIGR02145 family)